MASGNLLEHFTPQRNEAPSAGYATFDVRAGAANARHLVLDFDDATDESAEFAGYMPDIYAAGGLTVTIVWMMTTATAADTVVWDVQFKSVSDDADDLDTKAFATAKSVTATAPSASGEVAYDTITFNSTTESDNIAADEYFRVRITRDASGGTASPGDAELLMLVITET